MADIKWENLLERLDNILTAIKANSPVRERPSGEQKTIFPMATSLDSDAKDPHTFSIRPGDSIVIEGTDQSTTGRVHAEGRASIALKNDALRWLRTVLNKKLSEGPKPKVVIGVHESYPKIEEDQSTPGWEEIVDIELLD